MFLKLEDHRSRLQLYYKGPRGHPTSQMTKLRLRQYVLLSTSLGLSKSSNVLLHFILHIVFTPKDVQSLKPKDFVYTPPLPQQA